MIPRPRLPLLGLSLSLSLMLGVALAPTASAYVCATTETGASLFWSGRTVAWWLDEAVLQLYGEPEDVERAVTASFQAWQDIPCSDLSFVYQGAQPGLRAGMSPNGGNQNVVTRVDSGWRHDRAAIAVTTTTFDWRNGQLYDADIEINAQVFTFVDATQSCGNQMDLQNVLTHEVGHLLGLAHSGVRDATMYGDGPVCETKKRSLHADDQEVICRIYPAGNASKQCDGSTSAAIRATKAGGCSDAGPRPAGGWGELLGMLGLGGLWLSRRWGRRADPQA